MKHLKKFNESKSDYYTVTNGIADKVIDFNISNFNISNTCSCVYFISDLMVLAKYSI